MATSPPPSAACAAGTTGGLSGSRPPPRTRRWPRRPGRRAGVSARSRRFRPPRSSTTWPTSSICATSPSTTRGCARCWSATTGCCHLWSRRSRSSTSRLAIAACRRCSAARAARAGRRWSSCCQGLDSTKEGRHRARGSYLRRGVAVLSLDGPGQGEASQWLTIRPDYEHVIAAAIDHLETRDDLDASRVGIYGMSLGGYYAPRAAAHEPRISACAGNCGPYDWGACFATLPQVTREAFQHYSGAHTHGRGRRARRAAHAGGLGRADQPARC